MLEFHLFNYVGETINLHKNLQSANERYTRKKSIVNGHCSSFFFIRDNLPTIVDFSRSSLHFDIFSTDHTNDIAIRKVNSRNGLKAAKHEQQQVSRYHRKVRWSLAATRPTNSRVVSSQLTRRINDRPVVFCTTCRAATCHTVRRLLH